MKLIPFVVAGLTAYGVTLLDLRSTSYRRTLSFLLGCRSAHFLAAFYIVIAVVLLGLFDSLVAPNFNAEGDPPNTAAATFIAFLTTHALAKGLFVGVFANGLANLKLFSIPGPNSTIPFGFQTLTQIIDSPLREDLFLEHYQSTGRFCTARLKDIGKTDADLPDLKAAAVGAIPTTYPADQKAAIKDDFGQQTKAVDLLRRSLERFGKQWVLNTFP